MTKTLTFAYRKDLPRVLSRARSEQGAFAQLIIDAMDKSLDAGNADATAYHARALVDFLYALADEQEQRDNRADAELEAELIEAMERDQPF